MGSLSRVLIPASSTLSQHPTPDFLLTVIPAHRGRYRMLLDQEDLGPSRTPLYAAARVLLDRGADPEATLAMHHAGSSIVAMHGRIGKLAGWSILENDDYGPRRVRYRPFSRP